MPSLNLFDETLDINSTANYHLILQISQYEISYSILDTLRNKFVLLRSFEPELNRLFDTARIEEVILGEDYLSRQYKKIFIITPSQKSTLIPAPLYDGAIKAEYFTFNQILDDGEIILENRVPEPDVYIVYSFPARVTEFLNAHFPGIKLHHHSIPLLRQMTEFRLKGPGHYIHVHIEKNFFNLIISDRDTLRFCNCFIYSSIPDILYFVLNTFKKLGIQQEETIYISGSVARYDELHSGLIAYVRNLRYAEPPQKFTFSYVFDEEALHRYLNLFIAADCE